MFLYRVQIKQIYIYAYAIHIYPIAFLIDRLFKVLYDMEK